MFLIFFRSALPARAFVGQLAVGADEDLVAHAVHHHVHPAHKARGHHVGQKLLQVMHCPVGVVAVLQIAGGAAHRGPAVQQRRALKAHAVGDARGGLGRVLKAVVKAMHKEQHLAVWGARGGALQLRDEGGAGEAAGGLQPDVDVHAVRGPGTGAAQAHAALAVGGLARAQCAVAGAAGQGAHVKDVAAGGVEQAGPQPVLGGGGQWRRRQHRPRRRCRRGQGLVGAGRKQGQERQKGSQDEKSAGGAGLGCHGPGCYTRRWQPARGQQMAARMRSRTPSAQTSAKPGTRSKTCA